MRPRRGIHRLEAEEITLITVMGRMQVHEVLKRGPSFTASFEATATSVTRKGDSLPRKSRTGAVRRETFFPGPAACVSDDNRNTPTAARLVARTAPAVGSDARHSQRPRRGHLRLATWRSFRGVNKR
jgi:hypothetical protein